MFHSREEPPDDEFANISQKIADDLSDEAKIERLGGQLGIIQGDIQRALKTNMRFTQVTSDGTRHMLRQWRRGVSREDERVELRKALHAAKLVNIADLYLSKGNVNVCIKNNIIPIIKTTLNTSATRYFLLYCLDNMVHVHKVFSKASPFSTFKLLIGISR